MLTSAKSLLGFGTVPICFAVYPPSGSSAPGVARERTIRTSRTSRKGPSLHEALPECLVLRSLSCDEPNKKPLLTQTQINGNDHTA